MKNRVPTITTRLMVTGLLTVATFVSVAQKALAAEPPAGPAHATHVAASQAGGQTVDTQLAETRAKVQQLEAIIQQQSGQSPPAGTMRMAVASPPSDGMGMMDDMMEMGGVGGGAMPAGAPMGGAAPGGGMGMMDMDKMEMAGMMGMMGNMSMRDSLPAARQSSRVSCSRPCATGSVAIWRSPRNRKRLMDQCHFPNEILCGQFLFQHGPRLLHPSGAFWSSLDQAGFAPVGSIG